jgi:hypothetical protein
MPIKISGLPAGGPVANADVVPAVTGGATKKVTKAQLLTALGGEGIALVGSAGAEISIDAAGAVVVKAGSGANVLVESGAVNVSVDSAGGVNVTGPAGSALGIGSAGAIAIVVPVGQLVTIEDTSGLAQLIVGQVGGGAEAVALSGQIETDQTAAATTPGSVVAKLPIYDHTGALIGYAPLYDAIS